MHLTAVLVVWLQCVLWDSSLNWSMRLKYIWVQYLYLPTGFDCSACVTLRWSDLFMELNNTYRFCVSIQKCVWLFSGLTYAWNWILFLCLYTRDLTTVCVCVCVCDSSMGLFMHGTEYCFSVSLNQISQIFIFYFLNLYVTLQWTDLCADLTAVH